MDKTLVYGIAMIVSSFVAFAASYTGRLIDARCAEQQPQASCNPTPATSQFALISAGKLLMFDSAGNAKAADALRQRVDRGKSEELPDPARGVDAMVQGEVTGNGITVREIEIQ